MSDLSLARELSRLDATAQAELIKSGKISAVDAVNASIAAATAINPTINGIIHPRYDKAREEAAKVQVDAPFAGVPIVVKDLNCAIAGEPYHLGSRLLKNINYVAPRDSALAKRFRKAGFVIIGRTNTPEFGSTVTTEPVAYGPTRNPWNLEHSTGGSSGGSAATVAAGVVAVGHANDGGGSIRIPASECGLVGLKPTRGRVSQGPDLGETWAGATIDNCITRSVRDSAAVLDQISGYETGDPYTAVPPQRPFVSEVGADPGKLRIGILDHPLMAVGLDHQECRQAVTNAASLMESLGHDVEVAWSKALEEAEFPDKFVTLICAATHADLSFLERELGVIVGPDTVEGDNLFYREIGKSISAGDYLNMVRWMHSWSRRLIGWWNSPSDPTGGFDLLITPTLASPPPKLGWLSGPEGGHRVQQILQYTAQFNISGQPAISLPLHMSADGLPVGVQFVAAPFREDMLVRVASQLEQVAPWSSRVPSIHV